MDNTELANHKRTFPFATKRERNGFLQRNSFCIATTNGHQRVLNRSGQTIGASERRPDGTFRIDIFGDFLNELCEQDAA